MRRTFILNLVLVLVLNLLNSRPGRAIRALAKGKTMPEAMGIHTAQYKILIFVLTLLTIAVIFGALMYVVEGPAHGFDSIPTGMYWAVVTMATVGYGDLSPATGLGRFLTSALIIIGLTLSTS